MEPKPFVLEISSDEEAKVESNFDWIKEFLLDAPDEEEGEDVVAVLNEKSEEHQSKSSVLTPALKKTVDVNDDDDDDCVVLDGDPQKENLVTNHNRSSAESDELCVVAEKGQIACRDYPHPRHLCLNFPFSSTPHERYCNQCHCYVCDSPAPCLKWGTGLSSTDHCHATDKSETWKTLRNNFKLGKATPASTHPNFGTFSDVANVQHNHIPPLDMTLLSPNSMLLNQPSRSAAMQTRSSLNLIPQNQASQPILMRACSSLNPNLQNPVFRPNTIPVCSMPANYGRCQESRSTLVGNSDQSHSIPRQLLGVRRRSRQRERRVRASSLQPQFLRSQMTSNMAGSVGVGGTPAMNNSAHVASALSNLDNQTQQYGSYLNATGFSNNRTCHVRPDFWNPRNSLYPQTSSGLTGAHCQSNDSQNFDGNCVPGNDAYSSYMDHLNRNQHLYKHQNGSQNENAWRNIIQGAIRQDCQQKTDNWIPRESARNTYFPTPESTWAENASQSSSNLQNSGFINIPPNAKESNNNFTRSTNLNSVDDINPWPIDEENSASVEAGSALASEQSIPSPDLSTFDTNMFLYDF